MAKPKYSLNLAEPSFLSAKFPLVVLVTHDMHSGTSWHAVSYFTLWNGLNWLLLAHLILRPTILACGR